jgi:pimeloyl-ACP methyl ester carboxylesterase
MLSHVRIAVVLAALFAAAAAGEAGAAPSFSPCRPQLAHDVECSQIAVQLDRTGVVPGSLQLHVERIRARSKPARGTMFVLSGGPGESVTADTNSYANALRPALATHDLILVDQRGTGRSGALDCPALDWVATSVDAAREIGACGAAVAPRLGLYTTSDVVEDLEEVRRALGVERIGLFGVSYGTRIALAYAERYPQRVERLVLDSVVPLADNGAFRLNSFAAVPRVLKEVCAGACHFAPDPSGELAALVRRLEQGPLRGSVARGDGRLHQARIGRADLFQLLLVGDYLPSIRAYFPAAVHSAVGGDASPLLRLRELVSSGAGASGESDPRVFSAALYFAARCADSGEPWVGLASGDERSAAARAYLDGLPPERFAPFDRATALAVGDLSTCRTWPKSDRAAARFDGPLPDVPTLILAGTADLRTPLEDATALARLLPQADLMPVAGVGHATLFQGLKCVEDGLARFLSGERAGRCGQTRVEKAVAPAPDPRRPVPALASVVLTLDDILQQLPLAIYTRSTFLQGEHLFFVRAGGLRGGRFSATEDGLTLERVSVVPGVTVSGRIRGDVDPFRGRIAGPTGRLVVRLRGGRGGTLVLGRGSLSGMLAGRPVSRHLALDHRTLH